MHFEIWWALATFLGITGIRAFQAIAVAALNKEKRLPGPELDQLTQKIERMSQAIEATSIEVERIGESQRFLTRVLSDREKAQIGAG